MGHTGREAILITGANGFLGGLVASRALLETDATLVLPVRNPETRDQVVTRIAAEVALEGAPASSRELARLVTVPLPAPHEMEQLLPVLRDFQALDVLHCAGCLSYFNLAKLQQGNIELTRSLVDLAERLEVRRLVFLSTAYSSGIVDGPIPERLHAGEGSYPTEYMRTKRDAEWIVARSAVPCVIVRPSVVIGDSRDGRYGGKPYGVYQLWSGAERYLYGGDLPETLHVVAADAPINFLHQDAFTNGFWAAYRALPDGSIMHLVSREESLPTMRDLWKMWLDGVGGPAEVHFYDRLKDVPLDAIDSQMRLWLDFTAVNNEIASVRWQFETHRRHELGLHHPSFRDATLESVGVCQRRFLTDSPRLQHFLSSHPELVGRPPRIVVHPLRREEG